MTAAQQAEVIYFAGPILTMIDEEPMVEAVAVAQGRILAAGTREQVMQAQGPSTRLYDLQGRTLMPSFIDAHGHFMNALQVVKWANVSIPPVGPVTCIPDLIGVLQAHVAKFKLNKGDWIVAYGYDNSGLKEGRDVTRDDLDPYFPDNPILLIHNSNHGAILNSAAFALFKIDENTPTPPGGLIARKPGTNIPAGLLMETAFAPIFGQMPQPSEQELLATFAAAQAIYTSVGVTTVQEGATHAHDLDLLRKGAAQGRLVVDVVALPMITEVPAMVREYFPQANTGGGALAVPDTVGEVFNVYHNRLKLGGVKFIFDGSPQGKTAFWSKPLLTKGPNGEDNWRGQPVFPPEMANAAFKALAQRGVRTWSHCNGDAAIDMLLDAAEAAGVKAADNRRDIVVHSQFVRPDQLDSYVRLGFTPSFFTVHTFFWGNVHLKNLGEERAFFLSPMKSALALGLHCTNHNDFSVTPMDPMRMVWSAVTRQAREGNIIGPDERVSVWQALQALTINGAWEYMEEEHKGTIQPGKLADLIVLDANPLTVETNDILKIKVVETFKEGVSIYRAAA